MGSNHKVAILGAGIIGLSTALELQRRFPNCDVTVIADKFNMDTTSDGAAGLFEPSPNFMGPDLETTKEWIRYSYDHYAGLLSENCGVQVINGYNLAKSEKQCAENHYLKPVLPVYKRMSEEELAEIGPGDWKYGIYMSTLVIPNRIFLPWCMQKFKTAGGKVIEKYISSFSELGSEYNTIFNCTGLGARTLCNDMHVIPVRGQTIRIKAPHITNFYKNEYDTYIIPNGFDSLVTLGGTQNFGHVNRCVESTDTESILARTEELLPGVGACGGGQCWVGLRPHRYRVRVECEQTPGGKISHPHLRDFYNMPEAGAYIIPSYGGLVTLGGTQDYGNARLGVDRFDSRAILNRTAAVRPEILAAPVEKVWVGLRPYRHHVRVERDLTGAAQIVHNYGHGGYGVTSAPGSARCAVSVFEQSHKASYNGAPT